MMEKDNIGEFLQKMGMKDQLEKDDWSRIIQPNSSYLIVGDVGTGKSALAYYLLETFSQKYNLLPAVVGLPREKQRLLPSNFIVKDRPSECTELGNAIVLIDEADLQLPIEDTKARQYVVNFLSLPRHRKQIFLLAFHLVFQTVLHYSAFYNHCSNSPQKLRELDSAASSLVNYLKKGSKGFSPFLLSDS